MDESSETHVVTCFLEYEGSILILKRSHQVGSYQQKWAGISGYIEPGINPLTQALQEIGEEAGLNPSQVTLEQQGEPLRLTDPIQKRNWVVHPFRFRVADRELVTIDWEHSQFCWLDPEEIAAYDTVPGLYAVWLRVK